MLIIRFEEEAEAGALFQDTPIIGFEEEEQQR
jgi:hypothetical protein